MQNYTSIGEQRLIFGSYAVRRFCRLQGCTNEPTTILQEFAGPNREEALFNIVRAGVESDYAEAKKPFELTEYELSAFVDQLNTDPKADKVIYAFIGSVVNKAASDIPAWMEEVQKEAEKLAKEEKKALESPNAKAGKSSPIGKNLKPAASATD